MKLKDKNKLSELFAIVFVNRIGMDSVDAALLLFSLRHTSSHIYVCLHWIRMIHNHCDNPFAITDTCGTL